MGSISLLGLERDSKTGYFGGVRDDQLSVGTFLLIGTAQVLNYAVSVGGGDSSSQKQVSVTDQAAGHMPLHEKLSINIPGF